MSLCWVALIALMANAPSPAKPPDVRSAEAVAWDLSPWARAGAGVVYGWRTRRVFTPMLTVEVAAKPRLKWPQLTLWAPLKLYYQETFVERLQEFRGDGGLRLRWQPEPFFHLEPRVGLTGVWRPGWGDLYQPIPGDPTLPPERLAETERHSYGAWYVAHTATALWGEEHAVYLTYRYREFQNVHDPKYRSLEDVDPEPNHLVPGDHLEHRVVLRYRYKGGARWRARARLTMYQRDSHFRFARDAGTGKTHAAPGGVPANPLQQIRVLEPRVNGELRLWNKRLRFLAQLGWRFADDTFAGYYSYHTPVPKLSAVLRIPKLIELKAAVQMEWRLYGPHSYRESSGHPPLEYEDRRVDRRLTLNISGQFPLWKGLALWFTALLRWRDTNVPDYQPGVFPRTRNYDIDWDYVNLHLFVGVEYRR